MSLANIAADIPRENITIDPLDLHMEAFNTQTGDVWLHQAPVTEAQYKAFKPEPPFIKSGIGRSAMDSAHFLRSPGHAADGPLETRTLGGLLFARVARPRGFRGFKPGDAPTKITVEKHHVIGFKAGRRVNFVRLPDGAYYVQQTASVGGEVIPEPADWECMHLDLSAPWDCYLGCPVDVYFFRNMRSFMGPIRPDQMPGVPQRSAA